MKRAVLIGFLSLGGLVFLEISCRVLAFLEDRRVLSVALSQASQVAAGEEAELRQLMRASANDRIVYELSPSLSAMYLGQTYESNAAGFRDGEYPLTPEDGVSRIVGLGDSVMFGWGVANGEDYLSLAENLLSRRCKGRRWEAINTAVPGYNSVMEVETLREKGLAFRPDLVVLGWVANDVELPNFVRRKRDVLSLEHSFLERRVRRTLRGYRLPELDVAPGVEGRMESDPSRVSPEYRHLVGWEAAAGALRELAGMQARYGFEVLVVDFVPARIREESLAELLFELSFPVVEVGDEIERRMERDGITDYVTSDLVLSEDDGHPSAATHRGSSMAP